MFINNNNLMKLHTKEYFEMMKIQNFKETSLQQLTELFTIEPFTETKPYLYRRQLNPIDKRFDEIELVYDENRKVKAILWKLNLSISELVNLFGAPIIHYDDYSNSTQFAFRSENEDIEIITTGVPGNFEAKNDIENPKFSFIQFSLK